MDNDVRISEESAKAQLEVFYDYYDVDLEDMAESAGEAGEKALGSIKKLEKLLVKYVKKGRLSFNIEGGRLFITQHLTRDYSGDVGKQVRYKPISGKARTVCRKADDSNAQYALFASMAGIPVTELEKLEGPDLLVLENLSVLFLLL